MHNVSSANSKYYCRFVLLLGVFFSGLSISEQAGQQTFSSDLGDNLMLYRRYIMDTKGAHLKSIRFIIKNNIFVEHLPMHAEMLMQVTKDMRDIFPAGSTSKKSRAKNNIWNQQGNITQDFVHKLDDLYTQSNRFRELSTTKNFEGIKKQAEVLTKSCKACHYLYRGIRLERSEKDY